MEHGKIVQVLGPVVDVEFESGKLPMIRDALEVQMNGKRLVMEVSSHIGNNIVRCILLASSEGLAKGMERLDRLYNLLKDKEPMLYHLDSSYTNIVKTLVKEIKHLITRELNMELHTYVPTETTLKNMLIPNIDEESEQ